MKFVFLLLTLVSQPAFCGVKEVGNGGDVVVCRNDKQEITSTELLDFYEARVFNGQTVDLGAANLSRDDKVRLVIERLRALNPIRADRYQSYFKTFFDEADFVPGVKLRPIPDAQEVALPDGCTIEQAAIQVTPSIAMTKRYTFDKDLWDKLDANNQAGLLLHEVIFRENIEANIRNSINVRYVNRLLVSNDISKMSTKQYFDMATTLPLPDWEYMGYNIAICQPALVDGDVDTCGKVVVPVATFPQAGDGTQIVHLMNGFLTPPWAPWVNGLKQSAVMPDGSKVGIMGPIGFDSRSNAIEEITPYEDSEFTFGNYDLQPISNLACYEASAKALWQCGISQNKNEWSSITFYPDEKLRGVFLNFALSPINKNLPFVPCNSGFVSFDEAGNVTSCNLGSAYHTVGNGFDLVVAGQYASAVGAGLNATVVFDGWILLGGKKYYPGKLTGYFNYGDTQLAFFLLGGNSAQEIPFFGQTLSLPPNTELDYTGTGFEKFKLPDSQSVSYTSPWGSLDVSDVEYDKADPKDGGGEYLIYLRLTKDSILPDENGQLAQFPAGANLYFTAPPNQKLRNCIAGWTSDDIAIPCYGKPVNDNSSGH